MCVPVASFREGERQQQSETRHPIPSANNGTKQSQPCFVTACCLSPGGATTTQW